MRAFQQSASLPAGPSVDRQLDSEQDRVNGLFNLQQALAMPTLPSLTFSTSSEADEHDLHLEHIRTHQYDNQFPAPLGPFASLPPSSQGIKDWRILILVTSVNSFAQKVVAYFDFLGIDNYAVHVASGAEGMCEAAERFKPDVVVCPFLTARIPESVFTRVCTRLFDLR